MYPSIDVSAPHDGSPYNRSWVRSRRNTDTGLPPYFWMAMETAALDRLHDAVDRLVEAFDAEGIYLHGSHAYGDPDPDSDIDLLVIVEASPDPPHRRATHAYRALRGVGLPIEVKVVTRAEFETLATWRSSVERDVKEKGVVLYSDRAG